MVRHPGGITVEWAIAVSPYSDLAITKTAAVPQVGPGGRITYTLEYSNSGLAAANDVTITDTLPLDRLTNITYTSRPPLSATSGSTYVWMINRLSYGQGGIITITANASATMTLSNTATITGLNAIGGPTPDRNLRNNTARIGPLSVYLPIILKNR